MAQPISRSRRLILQNRMPDVVTPVKAILQHHHRILVRFIKADIAGIAADVAHLIGNLLPADRIGHPGNIRRLRLPRIVVVDNVGEGFIQRRIAGR